MEIHTRAQAIALGLKRYFTGKPCKYGHLVARHMVGGCVECKRQAKNKRRREWRRANANLCTPKNNARRVAKRKRVIVDLMRLQRGRCAYCRTKLRAGMRHVDHIEPRAKGGTNARRNYQLACAPCNGSKSDKDPILFAQEIGRLL